MYTRVLPPPTDSFFLLGARATGKTTWISQNFSGALTYDLLRTREQLRLSRDPDLLIQEVSAIAPSCWVVVDEVQRVPALLDVVQHLMATRGQRFVLSGSSARKLRRGNANLLAGRAEVRQMFPLLSAEIGPGLDLDRILRFGLLPLAVTRDKPAAFLRSYCDLYVREEVEAEALVRRLAPFQRFLEVAARLNAQVVNVSGVAREVGVSRPTVIDFFGILVDTLLGAWLPAWKRRPGVQESGHPKFFFFDTGVARTLVGRVGWPLAPEERGHLFEAFIVHELRAAVSILELDWTLAFWRLPDGAEVDIVIDMPDRRVAIELKSGDRWEPQSERGLLRFRDLHPDKPLSLVGVFDGERALLRGDVFVLTWREFLAQLWARAGWAK